MLDATLGLGGHAEQILRAIGPEGRLIGMDRDREALELARGRLSSFGGQVIFLRGHFGELGEILDEEAVLGNGRAQRLHP